MNEDLREQARDLRLYTRHNEVTGGGEIIKVAERQSKIAYTAVKIDIAFIFQQNNVTRPKELKNRISLYVA